MPAEFMPRHDEVETLAIELAQLLLSNWTGFMRFQSVEARRGAISALYESPPSLPPQITEGCAAYPVSNEDCCAILAAFLVAEDRFTGDQSEDC